MTLVRTSLLNGIATVVRILTAIGLNKVLAVYVGPAGYALVGQFANVVSVAGTVAGGAISVGVTKYTAEHHDDPARQQATWRAAASCIAAATLVVSTLLVVFSARLSAWLLGQPSEAVVFVVLAFAVPLLAFNGLLIAIMNGSKEVRAFVVQNVWSSAIGAAVAASLAAAFGLRGALFALALNQAIVVVVTLWLCRRFVWLRLSSFVGAVAPGARAPLLRFAVMTLTSALVAPLAQIAVRDHLLVDFGATAAGEWQAVFKISEIYLTLFTATLSIYYLPRLSEIRLRHELWLEIRRVYAFVLPLAALAAALMFALRSAITTTLFTEEFVGMVDLFGWQLFGDVLKIGSWILGFVMVARAMARWFILTEVVFSASWILLTFALTPRLGLAGAPAAFACNYAIYWIAMTFVIRHEVAKMPDAEPVAASTTTTRAA